MSRAFAIPVTVAERHGLRRANELVSVSVPFPQGVLEAGSPVSLINGSEVVIVPQQRQLAQWPDSSVKWLALDFSMSVEADSENVLTCRRTTAETALGNSSTEIESLADHIDLSMQWGRLRFPRAGRSILSHVIWDGQELLGDGGIFVRMTSQDDESSSISRRVLFRRERRLPVASILANYSYAGCSGSLD